MKLSSRMYRQVEIKIRRAIASEQIKSETTPLPEVRPQAEKSSSGENSTNR